MEIQKNKLIDFKTIYKSIGKFLNNKIFKTVFLCFLFCLFFLHALINSDVLGVLLFLISLFYVCFASSKNRISFIFFESFFTSLFRVSFIQFSLFTLIAFVCVLLSYFKIIFNFIRTRKYRKLLIFSFYNFFFVVSLFLSTLVNIKEFPTPFTTIFSTCVYFYLGVICLYDSINIKSLLFHCVIGLLLSCLIAVPAYFSTDYGTRLYQTFYKDKSDLIYTNIGSIKLLRFAGLSFDPNFFSFNCAFVVLLLWSLRKGISKFGFIPIKLLICLISLIGLLSLSKMYILFFLCFYFFIFYRFVSIKIQKKEYTMLGISFAFVGFLIFICGETVINLIFSRLLNEINSNSLIELLDSFSTHRFSLSVLSLNEISTNPLTCLFGQGLNGYFVPFESLSSHNSLIQLWLTRGLIGVVAYILPFLYFFKNKKIRLKSEQIFAIIALFILSSALPLETYDKTTLYIALLSLAWYALTKYEEKINFSMIKAKKIQNEYFRLEI